MSMTLHSLAEANGTSNGQWSSRKVTIKELASKLGVSVPTLRKYGECGLLGVDSVSGRTNLFDEAAAVSRVEEINRLKSRGYSLALIREKLEERPAGFKPLELGLEGGNFSHGRHVLAIMRDMDEYLQFARRYIGNGLRAGQGCIIVAHPDHRMLFERIAQDDGYSLEHLLKRHQLNFVWFSDPRFDEERQIEQLDAIVSQVLSAGWQGVRVLQQTSADGNALDAHALDRYEEHLTSWAQHVPILVVCASVAPKSATQELLHAQKVHREFVLGESVFLQP